MTVPPLEALHAEGPEPRGDIADHDQPVGVTHVDAERAVAGAVAAHSRFVRAEERIVVAHGEGVCGVLHVENLEPVLVTGHEHVGPAHLVIVGQVLPVGGPGADRPADRGDLTFQPRLQIVDP